MNGNFLSNKQITGSLVLLLLLGSLFLLVKTIAVVQGIPYIGSNGTANTITLSGKGDVSAVPDTAEISFSVQESANTVADAQKAATAKINTIVTYLKSNGFEDKDIKTENYNVYPKYENQPVTVPCPQGSLCPTALPPTYRNIITGYEVDQSVSIKTKKTDTVGDVLTKLGSLGASNISGVNFTVEDEDALQAQARDTAIADARSKADELAKSLGVHIVRVTSFSENGSQPYPLYDKAAAYGDTMSAGTAPSVSPVVPTGQNTIISNVSITYEIR